MCVYVSGAHPINALEANEERIELASYPLIRSFVDLLPLCVNSGVFVSINYLYLTQSHQTNQWMVSFRTAPLTQDKSNEFQNGHTRLYLIGNGNNDKQQYRY